MEKLTTAAAKAKERFALERRVRKQLELEACFRQHTSDTSTRETSTRKLIEGSQMWKKAIEQQRKKGEYYTDMHWLKTRRTRLDGIAENACDGSMIAILEPDALNTISCCFAAKGIPEGVKQLIYTNLAEACDSNHGLFRPHRYEHGKTRRGKSKARAKRAGSRLCFDVMHSYIRWEGLNTISAFCTAKKFPESVKQLICTHMSSFEQFLIK